MKLGQTSFIFFVSKLVSSVAGFVATIYFAQILGPGPLGVYYLILALVGWLVLPTRLGIESAVGKRLSEGIDQGAYIAAGGLLLGGMLAITALIIYAAKPFVNAYIGIRATRFVILLLIASAVINLLAQILTGQHLVHVRGLVKVTEKTGQSVIQVAAIVLGLGVTGLITGHVLGTFVAAVLGFYTVDIRLERPAKKHFKSLISYARYSWLGGVRSKAFNWVDILVLGFFVTSDKIGIYSVAWNVAGFLFIFASAMSETLFPEMSKLSTLSETAAVRDLVEKALGYTGLILIPGLIGGIVVGDGVLKIYGTEFTRGGIILVFLILTYLIYGYSNQLLTALNAIDRPELAFRVNLILVLSNLTLNTVLVYLFGWTGAAIATATASTLSLLVGYHYLSHLLSFSIPTSLIAKQLFAALCMGGVVYVGQRIEAILSLTESNFLTVLVLVSLGAATYFALMLVISQQFRETVRGNVPQRYQRFI